MPFAFGRTAATPVGLHRRVLWLFFVSSAASHLAERGDALLLGHVPQPAQVKQTRGSAARRRGRLAVLGLQGQRRWQLVPSLCLPVRLKIVTAVKKNFKSQPCFFFSRMTKYE